MEIMNVQKCDICKKGLEDYQIRAGVGFLAIGIFVLVAGNQYWIS